MYGGHTFNYLLDKAGEDQVLRSCASSLKIATSQDLGYVLRPKKAYGDFGTTDLWNVIAVQDLIFLCIAAPTATELVRI